MSTVGLSLSDKAVRFIRFKRSAFGNSLNLSQWEKAVLPIGAIDSGEIRDEAKIISSLKELSEKNNLRFVRASLPDEKAFLFTTTIDRVPDEGMRDAVAFIIEENVPVALADSVFDFEAVPTSDPKKVKVTVSVVLKETANSYIKVLESAGITPISFDIESQAIARAVIEEGDIRTTLIVNAGERKASFYVVEDEVVRFSSTPAQSIIGGGVPLNARELKSEMMKVMEFWNNRVETEGDGRAIERILLCGAGALNNELADELLADSSIEYNLADPWINTSMPDAGSAILPDSLEYVAAAGLALQRE